MVKEMEHGGEGGGCVLETGGEEHYRGDIHTSLMGVQPGSHCGVDVQVQGGLQRQDDSFQSIGCCLLHLVTVLFFYWSDGVPLPAHVDVPHFITMAQAQSQTWMVELVLGKI
jgi:hypothetical protein